MKRVLFAFLIVALSVSSCTVFTEKGQSPKSESQSAEEATDSLDFAIALQKAEQGDAETQCQVGECYYWGRNVEQDYAQAVYWFRKAADQGKRVAQYRLGYMYYTGKGISQDLSQAVYWYHEAAVQGLADAQYMLGYMYEMGEGVTRDIPVAMMWYKKVMDEEVLAQSSYNHLVSLGYIEATEDPL